MCRAGPCRPRLRLERQGFVFVRNDVTQNVMRSPVSKSAHAAGMHGRWVVGVSAGVGAATPTGSHDTIRGLREKKIPPNSGFSGFCMSTSVKVVRLPARTH